MYLVFEITQDIIKQTPLAVKTSRSYESKEAIQTKLLKKVPEGETEVDSFKLPQPHFVNAEVLYLNRHAGVQTTLEVIHMDAVKDI